MANLGGTSAFQYGGEPFFGHTQSMIKLCKFRTDRQENVFSK